MLALGVRMTREYADWSTALRPRERMSVSTLIDRALAAYAATTDFEVPPERGTMIDLKRVPDGWNQEIPPETVDRIPRGGRTGHPQDGETHRRVETYGPGRRIRSPGVLVCLWVTCVRRRPRFSG